MSVSIQHGDCIDVMRRLAAEGVRVDAIVTDPPYHFGSIVKRWSKTGGSDRAESRVGAYTRHAKGFMGKEWDGGDIAFQPSTWQLALLLLKPGGHLVAFGGTKGFHRMACAVEDAGAEIRDTIMWLYGSGFPKSHNQEREWKGWGTALKPAFEPIILAQRPAGADSVAANLARHGVGAINIDGCRVPVNDEAYARNCSGDRGHDDNRNRRMDFGMTAGKSSEIGRWPANVIHDGSDDVLDAFGQAETAARFFYCAKANRSDRDDGCNARNNHPTVKPTELMRYLVRLVTPPGGLVLDPFMGSGSTGRGAVLEGMRFVGIEREAEYVEIARARIAAASHG